MDSNAVFEIPRYDTYVVSRVSESVLLNDAHGTIPTDVWKMLTWDVVAEFVFDMSCFKDIHTTGEIFHYMLHTGVYHNYVLFSKNVISSIKYALDSYYSNSPWMQFWLTLLFIHFNKNEEYIAAVDANAVYENLGNPSDQRCLCKRIIDDMPSTMEKAFFKLATANLSSFADGDEIHIPLKIGSTTGLIVCKHASGHV